ncbi:hypothetical protein BSZ05_26640 (plasmid) [Vibrio mediterranei]|uniref:Conjugal transfer protein TraB n=3 Tax=Vibrio mediterranei TaxID=689 RepID=A0AAN1FMM0_9VIBR|nr:hypothetical protein BSZ05_26640 [Vibrio mediterranei]
MTLSERLQAFLKRGEHSDLDSEDKTALNQSGQARNNLLLIGALIVVGAMTTGYVLMTKRKAPQVVQAAPSFGEVLDEEYASDDAQSAARLNEANLQTLSKDVNTLRSQNETLIEESQTQTKAMKSARTAWEKEKADLVDKLKLATEQLEQAVANGVAHDMDSAQDRALGQGLDDPSSRPAHQTPFSTGRDPFEYPQPHYEDSARFEEASGTSELKTLVPGAPLTPTGIDTFVIEQPKNRHKRSAKNYVPAGSFVTAVMTGGAEANAGVSGESATSPVLFKMLNGGFLPNGHHTKLKGCTMTGSAYGDISSSRGIVRGDRLSCIRKDGSVLDIPIEATVFNFGKNGIAGTAIMRNSKIIQSAGVAGILTGLGNAATGLSQTQSTSALGTTNSVDPSKTGLNILGTATSEVAAKLSDYYLKLAEKYHPDIELRQGAVVNIVFLKGFPLYDTEQYAKAMDAAKASAQSQVTTLTASPAAALLNAANQNLGRATGRP